MISQVSPTPVDNLSTAFHRELLAVRKLEVIHLRVVGLLPRDLSSAEANK